MLTRRNDHVLAGHRGVVPDPRASALSKPLVLDAETGHRIRLEPDEESGLHRARTLPVVEFEVLSAPNGAQLVHLKRFFVDEQDAAKVEMLVIGALKRAGVHDEADQKRIARALASSLQIVERENPSMEFSFETNLGGFKLGVLKIAYEIAWYWLGDPWLSDKRAVSMREALNGNQAPLTGLAGRIEEEPDKEWKFNGVESRSTHFIGLERRGNVYVVHIRLFDVLFAGFLSPKTPTCMLAP